MGGGLLLETYEKQCAKPLNWCQKFNLPVLPDNNEKDTKSPILKQKPKNPWFVSH
jgi:hypothetical protein